MNIQRLYEFLLSAESKNFFKEIEDRNLSNINQIQWLKDKFPDYPIMELLTLERLRKNALKRIKNSERYLFTTKGVEQSSSSEVAEYHASIFNNISSMADLCCGNGIDLVNIAQNKEKVYAVDLSNNALMCSRYNSGINKLDNIEFLNMKAEDFDKIVEGVFLDPDRRPEERRVIQGEDISPNFEEIIKIIKKYQNVVVKLSPVFDYQSAEVPFNHTWEFISEDKIMKEILLCTGEFATHNVSKKVVLLPEAIFLENQETVNVTAIKKYIYDPDPAIIRSGLVQDLAHELKLSLINKHLSILTSEVILKSKFIRGYEVIDSFHYNKKSLQKYVKENEIGKLVIKVRGFPERPNQILQKLKLSGKGQSLIYLIRMDKEFLCLILNAL